MQFSRADRLWKRLRAARLDATYEQEFRRLLRVDLLILDDLVLEALDATETHDFYQVVVERHRRAATILTSNCRACWTTQAPVGEAVQPARWTQQLPISKKKRT